MEAALEAGAEDIISNEDGSIDVITNPDQLVDVKDALVEANHEPENAEVTMQASTSSELEQKGAESMLRLLDVLEDLDDVQKVYSNAEISDEILAQLSD
jgi:transcriptional/translational regulatory protein YebC/TACO1